MNAAQCATFVISRLSSFIIRGQAVNGGACRIRRYVLHVRFLSDFKLFYIVVYIQIFVYYTLNMEKTVYCLIGERCKRITFISQSNIPDVQIIRNRLIEVSNNDISLRSIINNKIIILQKFDRDRNDKLTDIEEDDEIENKSEVKVLLLEKSLDFMVESVSQKQEIDAIDIDVIHSEPMNVDDELFLKDIEKSSIIIEDIEEKVSDNPYNFLFIDMNKSYCQNFLLSLDIFVYYYLF